MIKLNCEKTINQIEKTFIKKNLPIIKIGDTVKIGVKIIEATKERVQFYEGTVIAKKNTSINTTITVRKIFQGIGIERIFLLHSPKISSINLIISAKVRRSKLYYLRELKGKTIFLKLKNVLIFNLCSIIIFSKVKLKYIIFYFMNI